MNQENNYVSAIDIGTTKIVALIGTKEKNGHLKILGMANAPSIGVHRGVIQNIEGATTSIKAAVDEVQKMTGLSMGKVFVGIAGQHIRSLRSRGYRYIDNADFEISEDDVIKLIEDMKKTPVDIGEEILHVLPQSFIVDNESGIKNPVGMCGRKLEANFHIVIGQIASANNIKKCINRVGLEVDTLILEPLASSRAVLIEDEKEVGVAMVDIGGGTTDIAVYYDGIIRHTAVIPFGGNTITNDIKTGLSIVDKYAEEAKIKHGSALATMAQKDEYIAIPGIKGREPKEVSAKVLANIIQARMQEIIGGVVFQLESSGFADRLGAGVVVTGGGAMLKHLPQLISFKTGYDVRIGLPNEYLTSDILPEVNQSKYATSIGLLLKGYEKMEKEGLLNESSVEEPALAVEPEQLSIDQLQIEETFQPMELPKSEAPAKPKGETFRKWKEVIGSFFDEKDIN